MDPVKYRRYCGPCMDKMEAVLEAYREKLMKEDPPF